MSSEQDAAVAAGTGGAATPPARRSARNRWLILIVAAVALNVAALVFVPPFPKGGQAGQACAFPICFIDGNLEFPPPHVVLDLDPAHPMPSGGLVITFHPSISSTMLTMWLLSAILIAVMFFATRRRTLVPGRVQNVVETAYERLADFAVSIGGAEARPYVGYFVVLFLFVLLMNWSGLVPPVGRIEELRAPSSDLNMTVGLALLSFLIFEYQGFRKLGARRYLAKFFPLYEFRKGIGAGVLAMLVGVIELFLDFVRPITLSMRLFGNIYGGEVALGVITSLTLTLVPVLLLGLEFMLNFIQALIFSILSLIYIVLAIESHHHEEGELAGEAIEALEGRPHAAAAQPA